MNEQIEAIIKNVHTEIDRQIDRQQEKYRYLWEEAFPKDDRGHNG